MTRNFKLHMFAQLLIQRTKGSSIKTSSGSNTNARAKAMPLAVGRRKAGHGAPATKSPHLHHIERALHFFIRSAFYRFCALQRKAEFSATVASAREKRIILKHHPNAALMGRNIINRLAVQHDLAMGCRLKACEHHNEYWFYRNLIVSMVKNSPFGKDELRSFTTNVSRHHSFFEHVEIRQML